MGLTEGQKRYIVLHLGVSVSVCALAICTLFACIIGYGFSICMVLSYHFFKVLRYENTTVEKFTLNKKDYLQCIIYPFPAKYS